MYEIKRYHWTIATRDTLEQAQAFAQDLSNDTGLWLYVVDAATGKQLYSCHNAKTNA